MNRMQIVALKKLKQLLIMQSRKSPREEITICFVVLRVNIMTITKWMDNISEISTTEWLLPELNSTGQPMMKILNTDHGLESQYPTSTIVSDLALLDHLLHLKCGGRA